MYEKFYSIIDDNFIIYCTHMKYEQVLKEIEKMKKENPSKNYRLAEEV